MRVSLPFQKEQIGDVVRRISRLEAMMTPWSAEDRRAHDRVRYLRANVSMQVKHPGGEQGGTYLLSRNVSSGGLCGWHRGFLYPGSVCIVELAPRDGESINLVADLKDCRYIDGPLHESNISFRERADLTGLLSLAELSALAPEAEAEPEAAVSLAGLRIMVTCCDEGVQGLVTSALDGQGCVIRCVETLGGAFDELRRSPFDVVVCGDLMTGTERATMLLKLRTNGRFHGAAVLAGFRDSVAEALISGDPDKKCVACDPFDAESVVGAMPSKRKAA